MSTLTEQPVPSNRAEVMLFNAGALDRMMNADEPTFTDRFGRELLTAKGANDALEQHVTTTSEIATQATEQITSKVADVEGVVIAAVDASLAVSAADRAATEEARRLYNLRNYPDVYAADPTSRPAAFGGGACQIGDRADVYDASLNGGLGAYVEKRFNGTIWRVPNIGAEQLALSSGSTNVGYDGGTAQDVLDSARPLQSFTALRAYTGRASGVRITTSGVAGLFQRATGDTTTTDNGGTVIVDGLGRRWFRQFSGPVDVKWFGAKGDGTTDDTAAIQAALSLTDGDVFFSAGLYGVKATDTALTLASNNRRLHGPGSIVPIANAAGYAPAKTLLVTGSGNSIEVELWNQGDLTTQLSTASVESPMDGIRVTGNANTISARVWNFVACITVKGGTGNFVYRSQCTVKQKVNLAWPNDAILFYNTASGMASYNRVSMAVSAATRAVTMSGVSGASTSVLRTGITIDALSSDIKVMFNEIGEGFVAGIHAEGTGGRKNDVLNNTIWKQRRNAINCAGKSIVARFNWCFGTFNTDLTVNLGGIIGSVEADSDITDNWLYCDLDVVEGIHILSNAERINILRNRFIGSFDTAVSGVVNDVAIVGNKVQGSVKKFAVINKPAAVNSGVRCVIDDNVAGVVLTQFVFLGSGMPGKCQRNSFSLGEGYVAADGVIEFGGGFGSVSAEARVVIADNECQYVGTTALTGAFAFVKSSATSGTTLRGLIERNTYPVGIFANAVAGTFLTGDRFVVERNSTAAAVVGARRGTLMLGATATTAFTNNAVTASSTILLTPLNLAAATLMRTKSLYVSARVSATRFELTTGDGTAPAGTEQFGFTVLD